MKRTEHIIINVDELLKKIGLFNPADSEDKRKSLATQAMEKAIKALDPKDITEQEVIRYWTGEP